MAQPTQGLRPARGGGLDLLRFAAALFVVLFHFGDSAPVPLRDLAEVWSRGYLATDFFLILSGFVLARAYGEKLVSGQIRPLSFWLKRLARSYPTHLITLALLVGLVATAYLIGKPPAHPEHFPLSGIVSQILLLHVVGLGGGQWNIPAWTLSALLICYAVMPWLWRAIRRLPGPLTPLILAITLLLAGQTLSLQLTGQSMFQLPYHLALIRAFPLFVTGLLLARTIETGAWTPMKSNLLTGWALGLLIFEAMAGGTDTLGLVAIMLLILGCGSYRTEQPIPGAAWGAKVSFSLFMTHTLVGAIGFSALKPVVEGLFPALTTGIGAWAYWLAILCGALIGADLYNRLIDAPLQRWIRRRWFDAPATSARVQSDIQLGDRMGQSAH